MEKRGFNPVIEAYKLPLDYQIRHEHHIATDNNFISAMLAHSRRMQSEGVRKERYLRDANTSFPYAVDLAFNALEEKLGERPGFNTAIFKRYTQGGESEAFKFHSDPEEFLGRGKDFWLYSPVGKADFSIRDEKGKVTTWEFSSDSALVIPGDIPVEHMVSEPDPTVGIDGERLLIFFGQSDNPPVPLFQAA